MKTNLRLRAQAAALAFASVSSSAVTLPPPPVSPRPVVNYEYDAQGNPTRTIQAPTAQKLSTVNTFDTLDRLATSVDPKASPPTKFGYDGLDRPTRVTDPRSLATQINRNGYGDITSIVSPDTGTSSFTYDAGSNLLTRTDSTNAVATMTYDVLNRVKTLVYKRGAVAGNSYGWTYDQTGTGFSQKDILHLTTLTYPKGTTTYAHDPAGNVVTATQKISVAQTVSYGYNAVEQLTSITYPSGRVLSLSYVGGKLNAMGLAKNASTAAVPMLSQIAYQPFGPVKSWLWQMASGTKAHNWTYDLSTRAVRYTADGETNSDSATYTAAYSPGETQIASLTAGTASATYDYNNLGQRIRKSVTPAGATSPTLTLYVYDEQGHLLGEYDALGRPQREYVWLGDTPVAVFTPDTVAANPPLVYYIDTDHLGTPRVVFDKNNAQRWTWLAEPFGTTAADTNPANLGAFTFNLRMPGADVRRRVGAVLQLESVLRSEHRAVCAVRSDWIGRWQFVAVCVRKC